MTLQTIAQLIMLATLILMITGRTPIYMTAITGAAISAIVAGFPLAGGQGMTVTKMIVSGLNPVIADMTGILLFIGIMQATGFLDVIIRDIVRVGNKIGGGVGVGAAGGVAAGVIGALTGFTQPVITAVITGPAAVRLGVKPNQSAGIIAHAGHIGNLAGDSGRHSCDRRHRLRPLQCPWSHRGRFHLRDVRHPHHDRHEAPRRQD